MPNGEPVPALGWVVVPLLCAAGAAVAAVMHYGAAVRRDAADTPNLPTAILGGAVAGFLASLTALVVWHTMPMRSVHPLAVGVLIAGLGGEYLGGRAESVVPAVRSGAIAAVVLFPLAAWLVSVLR